MKCLNSAISTFGIFLAATTTLGLYLLGLRFHVYLPIPLFFVSIGLMIGTIMYQCMALNGSGRFVAAILLEITITNLLFHLIYQIPGYGLWGSDAYADFASMKAILISGFVRGVPDYTQITSYFPVLHVFGAQITLVTDVDPFAVAKWFPSVIDIAVVPLLYMLVKHIFRQEKAALLSTLLFASLQHRSLFGSFFIRETIAVILAVSCVYLYFSAKSSPHPLVYRCLSVLLLAATVVAHHLTSLMLILFLVIHFLVTNVARFKPIWRRYLGSEVAAERMSLSFPILAGVATVTYWVTTVILPLRILADFARDLLTPASWGKGTYVELTGIGVLLPTVRYYVLIYGSYLCYVIFGLLLLGRMRPKVGSRHLETYSFTLYLIVCGLLGIISFYLLPRTVIGNRFVTFGWLFAFGPLVVAIFEYKKTWLVRGGVVFLLVFMMINLYTIHPTEWNPRAKGAGATASLQDFALAKTFDFAEGTILANLNNLTSIYYTQNIMGTDLFELSHNINVEDYDWIIVNRKGLDEEGLYSKPAVEAVSAVRRLEQEGSPVYDLVYESNNLAVFKKMVLSGP